MSTLKQIRETFLNYFENHGHTRVPSSSLLPHNDPTLMFVNAGMVQFKDVFTGLETRPYTKATTSQKCLRAGGKHNDLENVGYTARHHTFFEMLGNFSFGDYFKEEAITFAWNFVTKDLGINPDRLLVTVFYEDDESAALWKKITGFPDHKIIRIKGSDNFWSMGDVGPCGPCTEIFYDHGENIPGGPPGSPDADGDRFVEIWNIVFMQYEQKADGTRIDLPKPSVDTGMGVERIAAVMQGVTSNFDVDVFTSIRNDALGFIKKTDMRQSLNVIADHLRASSFLIADGVLPSNEGRGYVLRRIMRRGMRHAHLLGVNEPLMYKLVPNLVSLMGEAYPELVRAQSLISQTLEGEENRFQQALDRGLILLNKEKMPIKKGGLFPGDVAFKLYDTYGFPLDLTQDVLRSDGINVDLTEFQECMHAQKERARASWAGSGEANYEDVWFDIKEQFGATEFQGYTGLESSGEVLAIIEQGHKIDQAGTGQSVMVITNQTPFYGESGGQQGDTGVIEHASFKGNVTDTQKKVGDLHVHMVEVLNGTLRVGDTVKMKTDRSRRLNLAAHHSATHLLHAALRSILGDHVSQKGSLVAPDRLRFDFTHTGPISAEDIKKIETHVNAEVFKAIPVATKLSTPEQAMKEGAMGLFGEKYGDEVRVVTMGNTSTELCGGTHVSNTSEIGLIKIMSQSGISAGVRRIEAVAKQGVLNYIDSLLNELDSQKELHKKALSEANKKIKEAQRQKVAASDETLEVLTLKGHKTLVQHMQDVAGGELKGIVDGLKAKVGSGIAIVTSVNDGRVSIVVGVTADLTEHISAVDIVKAAAELCDGKGGGGRADMAQAGGKDPSQLDGLISKLNEVL